MEHFAKNIVKPDYRQVGAIYHPERITIWNITHTEMFGVIENTTKCSINRMKKILKERPPRNFAAAKLAALGNQDEGSRSFKYTPWITWSTCSHSSSKVYRRNLRSSYNLNLQCVQRKIAKAHSQRVLCLDLQIDRSRHYFITRDQNICITFEFKNEPTAFQPEWYIVLKNQKWIKFLNTTEDIEIFFKNVD